MFVSFLLSSECCCNKILVTQKTNWDVVSIYLKLEEMDSKVIPTALALPSWSCKPSKSRNHGKWSPAYEKHCVRDHRTKCCTAKKYHLPLSWNWPKPKPFNNIRCKAGLRGLVQFNLHHHHGKFLWSPAVLGSLWNTPKSNCANPDILREVSQPYLLQGNTKTEVWVKCWSFA